MGIRRFFDCAVGLCVALSSAPAIAQFTPDSDKFLEAVRKEEGSTAFRLLSEHPTLVNARDGKGDTALLIAVRRNDADWTGAMLNAGADVDLAGRDGDTPLIVASRIGFEDAVGWLLARRAKVDAANKLGETALIIAVQARNTRIARALLDAGADPDKSDHAGWSARDYAKRDTRARQMSALIESQKPAK